MQGWHTTFLGMRGLPRDISDFEMKAFFTFDGAERDAINARRGDSHKLGLALHIGFLRMSGRLLGAFRVIPVALWRHLGNELGIAAPEVASLRAMYERGRTLFDHQQVACTVLGFQWMSEHQRRSLVRELRDEVARCADRDQLLVRARQWLYKNKLVIVHERAIRTLIAAALAQLEVETGTAIAASVDPATLDRWRASVSELRPDGQTQQSWLWAAPAKHSTRQISEVLERIDLLYTLDVHKHLADIPRSHLAPLRAPTCLQAALSRSQDQRASAHRGGRMLSSVLPVHHHRPVDPYGAAPDRRSVASGCRRCPRYRQLGRNVQNAARRTCCLERARCGARC
uniref:Transposase, TnpA family n=1 Tax=Sym plasmid TaxID=28430 RepID=A0A515HJM9_9ZZZZ|nr:Transposase, TnpA family [Sym plasmid]